MKRCLIFLLTLVLPLGMIGCSASEAQQSESEQSEAHLEGKPWVNPEIPGNLPSARPSLEDHYYLNVNYDLHQKAGSEPGSMENLDASSDRRMKEEIWDFVNTGESTEAKSLHIITSLIMDGERRKTEGREPLMEYVRRVQATKTIAEFSALCQEEGILIGSPYAHVQMEPLLQEPERYAVILYLEQMIPQKQPEEDAPQETTQVQLDTARVEEELTLLGYDAEQAKQLTERLVEYQKKCNPEFIDGDDYDGQGTVSGAEIRTVCTPLYDELVSLGLINAENEADSVFQTTDYAGFRAIQQQYTEENLDLFQAIVCLSLSRYAVDYLDPDMYAKAHSIEGETDLEEAAFEYMRITAMHLTEQAYATERITSDMHDEITGLMEEYKEAIAQYMEQCEWLSEESRKSAADKARMMTLYLVTQAEHTDYESLLNALSGDDLNLLQAAIQQQLMEWRMLRKTAGKPYDREHSTSFSLTSVTTNATYEPRENAIHVMIGILEPEFYNRTSRETLLATIGHTISHEMGHGFDPYGIHWNASGKETDVLTAEDQAKYDERAQRLAANLSSIELTDGQMVDGTRSVNEEAADLLSVRVTLDLAEKTEGFDYDLFFRTLAGKFLRFFDSREIAMGWYASDPHPAYYIRTNYTFAQFEKFYETYPSVQEGTPMYYAPEKRESLW